MGWGSKINIIRHGEGEEKGLKGTFGKAEEEATDVLEKEWEGHWGRGKLKESSHLVLKREEEREEK